MQNPDVTGNNVNFRNLDVEAVLNANIAEFQNLNVAGLPVSNGVQTFRMPVSTVQQTIPAGPSWTTITFGGIPNLILAPGQYLLFLNGVLINSSGVAPNTCQVRITDPGAVNTVTQIVFLIPVSSYSPFFAFTYLDTGVYGLQFIVQINPSSDATLLASTNPQNQFAPQFVALQLRAA